MGRFVSTSIFLFDSLGLAGLRVGYSISDPTLASYMMAIKQPYNINVAAGSFVSVLFIIFADVAARATLANLEQAMKRVNAIKEEREKLKEEISSQFGKWLQVYPSEANFLLIKGTERSRIRITLKCHKYLLTF